MYMVQKGTWAKQGERSLVYSSAAQINIHPATHTLSHKAFHFIAITHLFPALIVLTQRCVPGSDVCTRAARGNGSVQPLIVLVWCWRRSVWRGGVCTQTLLWGSEAVFFMNEVNTSSELTTHSLNNSTVSVGGSYALMKINVLCAFWWYSC